MWGFLFVPHIHPQAYLCLLIELLYLESHFDQLLSLGLLAHRHQEAPASTLAPAKCTNHSGLLPGRGEHTSLPNALAEFSKPISG